MDILKRLPGECGTPVCMPGTWKMLKKRFWRKVIHCISAKKHVLRYMLVGCSRLYLANIYYDFPTLFEIKKLCVCSDSKKQNLFSPLYVTRESVCVRYNTSIPFGSSFSHMNPRTCIIYNLHSLWWAINLKSLFSTWRCCVVPPAVGLVISLLKHTSLITFKTFRI